MVDGIDGSGKSTAVGAWKNYLIAEGNGIFDLRRYWQETKKYPELEELKSYDFVFSCEPTFAGMGRVIREELIRKGTNYPALAIAEAYSLDRLILYDKIILPMLGKQKIVIEDRGVCTSLAYQTAQGQGLDFAGIGELPGNKLALKNRPDYLVLMKISPEKAMERIAARLDKKDDSIFERLEFMKKLAGIYYSEEYQKIFTDRGTRILFLNAEAEIDIMEREAVSLLKKILK